MENYTDIEFTIDKDLVFFDVEATGLNVLKDLSLIHISEPTRPY